MSPTSITHITNLDHDIFINLSSSFGLQILKLLLHFINTLLRLFNGLHLFLISLIQGFDILLGLLLLVCISCSNIDIDVSDFLIFDIGVTLVAAFINVAVGVDRRTDLRILIRNLFSLSLQFLSQILLLLGVKTFEKFGIPNFALGCGTLAFRVLVRGYSSTFLLLFFSCFLFSLFVLSKSASYLHIHLLNLIILTHFSGGKLTSL